MAVIEASAAGGKWSEIKAWVGEVVPTENDDVVFGEKSGSVEIAAEAKCRSLESVAAYAKTLTLNAAVTLKVGAATVNAANIIWRWLGGTFTLGNASTSAVTFGSSSATQVKIFAALSTFGNTKFQVKGSYKLEQKLVLGATATLTVEEATFTSNGQEISTGIFNSSSALTRTVNIENSLVKLTGTGTVWTMSVKTNLTFKSAGSTVEITDTSATIKTFTPGVEGEYAKLKLPGGVNNPPVKINQTCTIKTLEFTEGQKATLVPTSAVKITVEKLIGHGASGKVITIEAATAGTAFEFVAGGGLTLFAGLEWVTLKDCTGSAGSSWYAGANSTNVSGNTNWKFEAYKHPHTFEVAQPQSASLANKNETARTLSVSQAQTVSNAVAVARTLSVSQSQAPLVAKAITRVLAITQIVSSTVAKALTKTLAASQPQSVTRAAVIARTLVAEQPQVVAKLVTIGRALSISQPQAASRTEGLARTLSVSQGQEATQSAAHARGVTLSAAQGQSASLARAPARILAATQTTSATLGRAPSLHLSVPQGQSAGLNRGLARGLNLAQAQSCSLARGLTHTFSAGQPSGATLGRIVLRTLRVEQGQQATVIGSSATSFRPGRLASSVTSSRLTGTSESRVMVGSAGPKGDLKGSAEG